MDSSYKTSRRIPKLASKPLAHKVLAVILCAVLTLSLFGCKSSPDLNLDKKNGVTSPSKDNDIPMSTFSADGITITLPSSFQEERFENGVISFSDAYSVVLIMKEPFSSHPSLSHMSLEEYGQALIQSRNMDIAVQTIHGLQCFEYETDTDDPEIQNNRFVSLYKSNTAFWIVEFVSDSREAQLHRSEFVQWAKSVRFADSE